MDPLTHTLTGALMGQAGLKRRTGLAMPALIAGANLPDIDVACFLWLDGVEHLAFRRGITHGPIAWVLLPLLLAGGLWWFDRWQARRGTRPEGRLPVHFGWLYALSFLACLTHPALDWLNVYGVRLLEPFSSRWFYGDVLFIIDVWLWAIMGVGLWLSLRREKGREEWRRPAQLSIAFSLLYIFANGAITGVQERALLRESDRPDVVAIASPVPLMFWEREKIVGNPTYGMWFFQPPNGEPVIDGLDPKDCEVKSSARTDRDIDAFLFWARAPYIHHRGNGEYWIGDARYTNTARNRFAVKIAGSCLIAD